MTEKLNPIKPILGYTDTETVKLDFDDIPFSKVKELAMKTMEKFGLGGFLILKSSKQCYHVVFDHNVSWIENVRVMAWVAIQLPFFGCPTM